MLIDKIILLYLVIFLIIVFLFINLNDIQYVSIDYILGQTVTESQIHLMAIYIIIGIYIGIIYFYYNDVLEPNGYSTSKANHPFAICYIIAGLFNKMNSKLKYSLIAFTFILKSFVASIIFWGIEEHMNNATHNHFIFMYNKPFYAIIYAFTVGILLTLKSNEMMNYFISLKMFAVINRISTSLFFFLQFN